MTKAPTNLPASIRARLLAQAKAHRENFNALLKRYGVECFLRRLAVSPHASRFVLKGAMLFVVWDGKIGRPTRDLDLLGLGEHDPAELIRTFKELASMNVEDGMQFLPSSITAQPIAEEARYHGTRLKLEGRLDGARIYVQVDVGAGDAVVPEVIDFPTLLGTERPRLRAYRRETVVAEKLHAIVHLGDTNTRMYLKWKGVEGDTNGDFFVRSGPRTDKLSPDSAAQFIRTRFEQR